MHAHNHKKRCYIQPRQPEPSRERLGANYASLWCCREGKNPSLRPLLSASSPSASPVFSCEGRRRAQFPPTREALPPALRSGLPLLLALPPPSPLPHLSLRRGGGGETLKGRPHNLRPGYEWAGGGQRSRESAASWLIARWSDGSSHRPLPAPLVGRWKLTSNTARGRLFMELEGLPGSSVRDGDLVNLQEGSQRQRRRGSGWLN